MSLTDKSLGKWEVTLIDAGDGGGDCHVEFPKEFLDSIDWHEGDVINFDAIGDQLLLTKINT